MNYSFLEAAKEELEEAVRYYEEQREGLGSEFAQEITTTITRIQEYPDAWAKISKNARCCRTKRFPYGIIYTVRGEEILILAVMHLHRKPGYWKKRL
jgi:plasmid stabilization system protein ParE